MKAIEKKSAKKEKILISKSMPKAIQEKLKYLVGDIIADPREKNALGNPEELKHHTKETWSRELTKKDRIVYGIEPGKTTICRMKKKSSYFISIWGIMRISRWGEVS